MPRFLQARTLRRASCAFAVAIIAAAPHGANAQDAAKDLRLELNRLEPRDNACRTYLLIDNGSKTDYKSLKLDLFVLDKSGVIAQRIAVETAPLPPEKTTVKLFDFPGASCDSFGRILLNGVIACEADGGARDNCLGAIETASKTPVQFTK